MWKEATNEVISSPDEFPFQLRTFDDFAADKLCAGKSLWDHVSQFYQPHDLETELEGFGNIQKPKWTANHVVERTGVHGTVQNLMEKYKKLVEHGNAIPRRDGYQETTTEKSVVIQPGLKMVPIQKPRPYKLDVNKRFIFVSAYTFWPYIIFVCLKGS